MEKVSIYQMIKMIIEFDLEDYFDLIFADYSLKFLGKIFILKFFEMISDVKKTKNEKENVQKIVINLLKKVNLNDIFTKISVDSIR